MMQVAKRIPFEDPNVLNICRAIYIASNLIILGINMYIKVTIDKKKGTLMVPGSFWNCAQPFCSNRPARLTILSL